MKIISASSYAMKNIHCAIHANQNTLAYGINIIIMCIAICSSLQLLTCSSDIVTQPIDIGQSNGPLILYH